MTRDPRYDILFEPVRIGPVTARNRFFQVPHCNGMGYRDPSALAAMRGMKAEGGWAVVCTEMTEIHRPPMSRLTSNCAFGAIRIFPCSRALPKGSTNKSLAGIELCHSGYTSSNL